MGKGYDALGNFTCVDCRLKLLVASPDEAPARAAQDGGEHALLAPFGTARTQ